MSELARHKLLILVAALVFFTNLGTAYSCRIVDVPATTGYGEPIQRLFKLKDGERVVAAVEVDVVHGRRRPLAGSPS